MWSSISDEFGLDLSDRERIEGLLLSCCWGFREELTPGAAPSSFLSFGHNKFPMTTIYFVFLTTKGAKQGPHIKSKEISTKP